MIGLKTDVNPSILSIDDKTIAYVCGHNVIIYDTVDRSQKYIYGKSLLIKLTMFRCRGISGHHSDGAPPQ